MQERALALHAKLDIWSEVNRGTEIELTIPGSTAYAADRRRLPLHAASEAARREGNR